MAFFSDSLPRSSRRQRYTWLGEHGHSLFGWPNSHRETASIVGVGTEGANSSASDDRRLILTPMLDVFKPAILLRPFCIPSVAAKYEEIQSIGEGMKRCRKCHFVKPTDEFRKFAGKAWRSYRCRIFGCTIMMEGSAWTRVDLDFTFCGVDADNRGGKTQVIIFRWGMTQIP